MHILGLMTSEKAYNANAFILLIKWHKAKGLTLMIIIKSCEFCSTMHQFIKL